MFSLLLYSLRYKILSHFPANISGLLRTIAYFFLREQRKKEGKCSPYSFILLATLRQEFNSISPATLQLFSSAQNPGYAGHNIEDTGSATAFFFDG
jgi:hypothetical protein